jgi:hypothetical protein
LWVVREWGATFGPERERLGEAGPEDPGALYRAEWCVPNEVLDLDGFIRDPEARGATLLGDTVKAPELAGLFNHGRSSDAAAPSDQHRASDPAALHDSGDARDPVDPEGAPDLTGPSDPDQVLDPAEPSDPDDALYLLGERCAQAYMQAARLHSHAMTLLAEFDRRRGWEDTGFGCTAEWLAWRIGIKLGAARERVRAALALEQLPRTRSAMENGELSFTKVRALTRVATPENETVLLELARAGSAANLERVVRGWKRLDRKSEVDAEQLRYRSRTFSAFVDEDGMVVVRGRLDPEAGAMLMRAVEAASEVQYRREARGDKSEPGETTPERRRADAVGLLAERALAAGFGDVDGPVSGSRADRTQLVLHVDVSTLAERGDPGLSELEDGTRVSAETSRRIACDTGVVRLVVAGGDDEASDRRNRLSPRRRRILDVGRRTRSVPPSLRRALEARDRGCRFPGCGLRFTDAHHVKHWADGGETSLRNLVLLCRRHHRAVHEGGVTACIDKKEQVVFFTPKGRAIADAPRLVAHPSYRGNVTDLARSLDAVAPAAPSRAQLNPLPELNIPPGSAAASLRASGYDGSARWKRDSQVPWAIEARVVDVLDSGT